MSEERVIGYRCEGCGRWFDQKLFSHARSERDVNGHEIPIECGPITAVHADPECEYCGDSGVVDVDMGGGNTREQFCECHKGQELLDQAERAREDYWDRKVHERIEGD